MRQRAGLVIFAVLPVALFSYCLRLCSADRGVQLALIRLFRRGETFVAATSGVDVEFGMPTQIGAVFFHHRSLSRA